MEHKVISNNPILGLLHRHPRLENKINSEKGYDHEHIVVDKEDWDFVRSFLLTIGSLRKDIGINL